jgi:hypothetical protein
VEEDESSDDWLDLMDQVKKKRTFYLANVRSK